MKRGSLLHPRLSHLLASCGHSDAFTICDRGFPVPMGPERIDLALTDDIPTIIDVLRIVHAEFVIDRVVIPTEAETVSPAHVARLRDLIGDVPLMAVPHTTFKRMSRDVRGTVRTGDTTAYGNIIVVSG